MTLLLVKWKGGAEIQTVSPTDADGDLVVRASGRNWFRKVIHVARTEDHIKTVPVLERSDRWSDKSGQQEPWGGRFCLWCWEAQVRRPSLETAKSSSATRNDSTSSFQ